MQDGAGGGRRVGVVERGFGCLPTYRERPKSGGGEESSGDVFA